MLEQRFRVTAQLTHMANIWHSVWWHGKFGKKPWPEFAPHWNKHLGENTVTLGAGWGCQKRTTVCHFSSFVINVCNFMCYHTKWRWRRMKHLGTLLNWLKAPGATLRPWKRQRGWREAVAHTHSPSSVEKIKINRQVQQPLLHNSSLILIVQSNTLF